MQLSPRTRKASGTRTAALSDGPWSRLARSLLSLLSRVLQTSSLILDKLGRGQLLRGTHSESSLKD